MKVLLSKKNSKNFSNNKGFTLLEMLTSLAIISIIMGVIFWNQQKFNNDMEITNLGYRIALAIREAQIAGTSVRVDPTNLTNQFDSGYGVHFTINDPYSYIYFADRDNDGQYDDPDGGSGVPGGATEIPVNHCNASAGDECITKTIIGRGNRIGTPYLLSNESGGYTTAPGDARGFDVVFQRPNPDAKMFMFSSTGQQLILVGNIGVSICLFSPLNRTKIVSIFFTGQILVGNSCS